MTSFQNFLQMRYKKSARRKTKKISDYKYIVADIQIDQNVIENVCLRYEDTAVGRKYYVKSKHKTIEIPTDLILKTRSFIKILPLEGEMK